MIDLHHIAPRHDEIDRRLIEWARWVTVRPRAWARQPMFMGYQSKSRQWDPEPVIHVEINTIAASEIERAVSILPDKHQVVTRWAYVFYFVPVGRVQREIGVTLEALAQLLSDSRDMLINRLKQKLVDNS